MNDFVREWFAVHHHLEVSDVRVFREHFESVRHAVVRRLGLEPDQQFFFAYGVEELIIDGNLQMVAHTVDGQHLLFHADVGFCNRNQLVAFCIEHTVVGGDEKC